MHTPFNASSRNLGQLFGLVLNDYTDFHFFKGWPKYLPALWSNHLSYTRIPLFCQCGRNFGQCVPFLLMLAIVFPSKTSGRNFCQLAILVVHKYYTVHSYKAAFFSQRQCPLVLL